MIAVRKEPTRPMAVQQPAAMSRIQARNVDGLIIFTGIYEQHYQSLSSRSKIDNSNEENSPSRGLTVPSVALSFADSRSTSPTIDGDGPNSNGTYSREYTLRHPEINWIHRGQGRYRPEDALSDRSHQTPSASQDQNLLSPELRKSRRSRTSDVSEEDRFEPRSKARRLSPRSTKLSDTTYTLRRRQSDQGPSAAELREARMLRRAPPSATSGGSQSTEMLDDDEPHKTVGKAYVEAHPEIQFRHCGNSFYRRAQTSQMDLVPKVSRRTSSRSFTKSDASQADTLTIHSSELKNYPGEKFRHRGNGYYRRESAVSQGTSTSGGAITERSSSPRSAQRSVLSTDEDSNDQPVGLVTKQYVDEHPEMVFHHRGQGRWAPGPRAPVVTSSTPSSQEDSKLVDRAYVDAHPEETFHHRGQGRWAKGLPPPGSSNKMAVRGPMILEQRDQTTPVPDLHRSDISADDPQHFALFRKEDGPLAFPHLEWFYRGGGKWSRVPKSAVGVHEDAPISEHRQSRSKDASHDHAASRVSTGRRGSQQTLVASAPKRKHSDDAEQLSGTSTPRPKMLTLEEDQLGESDLPELYLSEWPHSSAEEDNDEAAQILQQTCRPLNDPEAFIKALTKFDPSTRPTEVLYKLAVHVQAALRLMQDEYLEHDKITAPHARIPRKVATGGRLPVEHQLFEDRKEADLYDYQVDLKKIGYQDPEAQKISRDIDGRELRKRRKRGELDPDSMLSELPLPRRTIKPVERFEGAPGSTRRSRLGDASKPGSVTPDRFGTPEKTKTTPDLHAWAENYIAPKSGRWANHIPKRIQELRGGSAGANRSEGSDVTAADEDEVSSPTRKSTSSIMESIEDEMEIDSNPDVGI